MNAFKVLLVGIGNVIAVFAFVIAGVIFWTQAAIMLVGAVLGGYFGAYFAQRMDEKFIAGRRLPPAASWLLFPVNGPDLPN